MSSEHRKHDQVAWQGWKLRLSANWSPVKLEGDFDGGHALFADLLRPRAGIRWSTPNLKKISPEELVKRAMRDEVGELALKEARPVKMGENWVGSMLYEDLDPPGRDVFVAFSKATNRLLVLAYHLHRRERILTDSILPGIADSPVDEPMIWSVFDLNCCLPAGWMLEKHLLNAGDLSLAFFHDRHRMMIRQIAVAEMAIKRMGLDEWLLSQQRSVSKHYDSTSPIFDMTIGEGNENLMVRARRMQRRTRFFLAKSIPRTQMTVAMHDVDRDRLILAQGSDEKVLDEVILSIGKFQV